MNTQQAYLDFITEMIAEAGEHALKHFRSKLQVDNKGSDIFDPVTQADREVEQFIRDRITRAYPQHNIIGEEFAPTVSTDSMTWIIDPIDGTRSFVSGLPVWGILVGVMDGDKCVAGGMRQPVLGESWVGDGRHSYLIRDNVKIENKVRQRDKLADAVLCCTHPYMYPEEESLARFNRVLRACQFSRFGTDCMGYAMLASGYVDLVIEGGLSSYDIMPLIPVIEGAGGIVTDWQGNSAASGGLIIAAGNENLYQQAMSLLNP
ncbi:MAG: inositol monophosphatase family protein [Gammaproteobacteria bacterium]